MAVNLQLDELIPTMYIAEDCFEYDGKDVPNRCYIASVKNFVYSKTLSLDLDFLNINRALRLGDTDENALNKALIFNAYIKNAPTLDIDMVLYRGLPKQLDLKVGDILENQGFIFCSISKNYALWYAENDTSYCYTSSGIDITLTKPSKKYTLFRILVKKGFPFIETSGCDYDCGGVLMSEIILPFTQKLKVTCVKNHEISCETIID